MPTVITPDADIRERIAAARRMVCRKDGGKILLTGTTAQCLAEALAGERFEPWYECGAWAGVKSDDDRGAAFHLGYYGWTDGLDAARSLFRSVTAQHTNSLLREPVMMDEPGDVDVAAFLCDADLQWLGTRQGLTTAYGPGSVVRFEHSLFTSAGVDTGDMVVRGLVVVAAAYMLERAGLRTEITGRLKSSARGGDFDIRVAIKAVHEPLVLGRALYWLAHPSVLRIILHQIGTLHGNGQRGYYRDSGEPLPGMIRTPGQMIGGRFERLQDWLKQTLTQCGLKVRQ